VVATSGSRALLDVKSEPDLSISSAEFRRIAFGKQFQDLFWDLYMPQGDCAVKDEFILKCGHPINWTLVIPQMPGDETALNLAFLAVSAARVGRDHKDRRLVEESLKIYGKALRDLQSALYDPKRMYSDETLVACMLLNLYEIFEGSDRKTLAWISHSQGAARLVELRGVGRHATKESNFLFCGTRVPIILAAIVRRQATFLSSPDWLTKPWEAQGMPKTWADRLFDAMAAIPSILELYDLADAQIDSPVLQHQGQKLMRRLIELCFETNKALQNWYTFTRDDAKPRVTQSAQPSDDGYPFAYKYHFKNHLFAQALLMYWTSGLIVQSVIRDLNDILLPRKRSEWRSKEDKRPIPVPVSSSEEIEMELALLQSFMNPRQHAVFIAQSIPYFLLPDMRALGVNYVSFPMGMSFTFFRGGLHPGCRFTWRLEKQTRAQVSDNDISKEDKKIVAWFNETFEDMKKRGMPTNWSLRGRDCHPS
jgi:hypothetical protein